MKHINSLTNQVIKNIVKLHDAKGRAELDCFIAEGVRTCETLVNAGVTLGQVFTTEAQVPLALQFCTIEKITVVTPQIMAKISAAHSPSGILSVFKIPEKPTDALISSGIALAQIADPGNAGTLIRTAAAVGMKTIVCVEGIDPWSPKVVQASAGTIGAMNLFKLSWDALKKLCAEHHVKLSALVATDGTSLLATPPAAKELFVVGNEAHGLPAAWSNSCDRKVTLPMPGNTESLNAAIAGSIALYVAYLQREQGW